MEGDPPDLPTTGYSDLARDFVRGCLHKVPKFRPTYAMLLQHPWLQALALPPTIAEEDEDSEIKNEDINASVSELVDHEVAEWVNAAVEKRRNGTLGKSVKPALHAAPLDAVPNPAAGRIERDTAALSNTAGDI